jgi:hypothetical protein
MPGLIPHARPKPLRRGEGPGIHDLCGTRQAVDSRDKPGHDAENVVVEFVRVGSIPPGSAKADPRDQF